MEFLKKMLIYTCSFVLTLVILISSQCDVVGATGTSSDVIDDATDIIETIERRYSGKDDLTVTQTVAYYETYGGSYSVPIYEKKLDTKNYSQYTLNQFYNNQEQASISGTCAIVATTSIMEYYSRVKNEFQFNQEYTYGSVTKDVQDYRDAFVGIYKIAETGGIILPFNGGTLSPDHSVLLNRSFSFFDSNNTSTDHLDVFDTVEDEVKAGRPVLFNVSDHAMVATGVRKYFVSYTETTGALWWKKTVNVYETVGVLVVNDGWSNTDQYSYYLETDIPDVNLIYLGVSINEQ
jgi:hypothetical protein